MFVFINTSFCSTESVFWWELAIYSLYCVLVEQVLFPARIRSSIFDPSQSRCGIEEYWRANINLFTANCEGRVVFVLCSFIRWVRRRMRSEGSSVLIIGDSHFLKIRTLSILTFDSWFFVDDFRSNITICLCVYVLLLKTNDSFIALGCVNFLLFI